MEQGFVKANSTNLPEIDAVMLGVFFASNTDFCSAEFRNIKTSKSSRASYGDDAISYVQLKRDGKICTLKCKICPEHKIHAKLYAVTMVIDEEEEVIRSVECHDCVAALGGCKHAIAFLMWVHRRSAEPSCTSIECYWKKSKLSRIGTTLKFITAKEMSKGKPVLPSNTAVRNTFLEEGRKRSLKECEFLRYSSSSSSSAMLSMHDLVLKFKDEDCDTFLSKVEILDESIKKIEEETREQSCSRLWFEMRYGRITASRAYEVSRCKTIDGTLIALIMGGKIPDTKAMKRGRKLEDQVRDAVQLKLQKKIRKCGLLLSQKYPVIAGSPDGIFEDGIIEIKCPSSKKFFINYIKNGEPTRKFYTQMQIQMFLSGKKNCYFCVASADFSESNKEIDILNVIYNEEFVIDLIKNNLINYWKEQIYPLLYKCCSNIV